MKTLKYKVLPIMLLAFVIAFIAPKEVQADLGGSITVTPDNFEEHFSTSGDARWDASTNTVRLTDKRGQFSSFHLKDRINPNSSFTLKGKVMLGTKTDIDEGADGIGFAFFPGQVGSKGFTGGGLGIAGIPNATGFKFDTYYNRKLEPSTKPNETDIGKLGIQDDWTGEDATGLLDESGQPVGEGKAGKPFGGFLTTDNRGYADNDVGSNKLLPTGKYLNKDSVPVPIEFIYDGNVLKIILNGNSEDGSTKIEWDKDMLLNKDKSVAFHVSASTGGFYNEQYFVFESFKFNPVKKITVNEEWVGDEEDLVNRPDETKFTLIKTIDGVEQPGEEKTITGGASKELDELPEYTEDNKKIEYSIKAVDVPGYTTTVEKQSNSSIGGEDDDKDIGDETWKITHTYNGTLKFKEAPELLKWTGRTIPRPNTILSRDTDNGMTIAVLDTRKVKTNDWHVRANLELDTTSPNNEFKLFTLDWKNTEADEPVALEGKDVLDSTVGIVEGAYSKTWSPDAGVVLKANDFIPIGEYNDNVKIRWTLYNTGDPEDSADTSDSDSEGGDE